MKIRNYMAVKNRLTFSLILLLSLAISNYSQANKKEILKNNIIATQDSNNGLDISYKPYGINGYQVSLSSLDEKSAYRNITIMLSDSRDFFLSETSQSNKTCKLEKKNPGEYLIPVLNKECDFLVKAVNLHAPNSKTGILSIMTERNKYLFNLTNNTYLGVGSSFKNSSGNIVPAVSRVSGKGVLNSLEIIHTFDNISGAVTGMTIYNHMRKSHLVAITNSGDVFSWYGDSWIRIKSFGPDVSLNRIVSYNHQGKNYLVVGGNNKAYQAIVSQFDGKRWSNVYLHNGGNVASIAIMYQNQSKTILVGMGCGTNASACLMSSQLPIKKDSHWRVLMSTDDSQITSGSVNSLVSFNAKNSSGFSDIIAAGSFGNTNQSTNSLYLYEGGKQWQSIDGAAFIPGITALSKYYYNHNNNIVFPYTQEGNITLQYGNTRTMQWQPMNISNPIICRDCSASDVRDMINYYVNSKPYAAIVLNEYDQYTETNRALLYYISLSDEQKTFMQVPIDQNNFIINADTLLFYSTMTMTGVEKTSSNQRL